MFTAIVNACETIINRIKNKIKQLTKPTTPSLAFGTISDLPHSKTDLIAENTILRQQVIVLNRQVKRPQLTTGDHLRFVFLARLTNFWHSALHIVQPETLLRWRRDLFRRYWKQKSKPKNRKPRIPREIIDLIKKVAI
jgi:hypothetical protein